MQQSLGTLAAAELIFSMAGSGLGKYTKRFSGSIVCPHTYLYPLGYACRIIPGIAEK